MTTLEKVMEERGIGPYRLTQVLGFNPQQYTGSIQKKVSGSRTFTADEFKGYIEAIEKESGKPLSSSDVPFDIVTLRVK